MACIVVKRGDFSQYERLYKAFGDRVPVVWDRRRGTREPPEADTERQERRHGLPVSWTALGFVVSGGTTK